MTCSAFLAGLLLLKLDQNFLVICGPSVSIKKASTNANITTAKKFAIELMDEVRISPKLLAMSLENLVTTWLIWP